jgi:hypothetical protein
LYSRKGATVATITRKASAFSVTNCRGSTEDSDPPFPGEVLEGEIHEALSELASAGFEVPDVNGRADDDFASVQ